jgi:crotonobetainyl-CoA:carnitine CoA-transferase CaiB-like acyl-CoA transferase
MKLSGLRVIDLSNFLPGPYLTLAMADHGAEVIKIELPGEGDPARHIGLRDGEHTVMFRNINRGKKSVALNLKEPTERDALLQWCDSADVFVESFRPGVMARLGLDYTSLAKRNPGIVYCSISAFGQTSRWRDRPAHDLATEAMAGASSITTGEDGKPAIPGIAIADILGGLHGLAGVMMALYRRQSTGRGDHIDISMLDSVVSACVNVVGPTFAEGRQPVNTHERTTGGSAFYRFYECADGRRLSLAGQEPKFVRALLIHLGREDLIEPVLRGPGAHQEPVMQFLSKTFRSRPLAEWEPVLDSLDLCWGPVRTLPEAFADPNLEERGMLLRDDAGRPHIGSPIHFLNEPARPSLTAPRLSEHAGEFGMPKGAAT